jgi:multidrug resistance efflux pump
VSDIDYRSEVEQLRRTVNEQKREIERLRAVNDARGELLESAVKALTRGGSVGKINAA